MITRSFITFVINNNVDSKYYGLLFNNDFIVTWGTIDIV